MNITLLYKYIIRYAIMSKKIKSMIRKISNIIYLKNKALRKIKKKLLVN